MHIRISITIGGEESDNFKILLFYISECFTEGFSLIKMKSKSFYSNGNAKECRPIK